MEAILGLAFGLFFYFLPSIIGRHKRNAAGIIWLNLLGGWTGLGWIIAFIWSLTKDASSVAAVAVPPAPVVPAPVATRVAAPTPRIAAPVSAATRVAGPAATPPALPPLPAATPITPTATQPATPNVTDELERLFTLKEKGALTEEEYHTRKAKLLA